jgi:hypothetical protein
MMKRSRQTSQSLWRDRAFLLFWSGRAVSLLGTSMTGVVFPLLVYRMTRSALGAALGGVLAQQISVCIAILIMASGVMLSILLS